jgi:hypothetical protein
MKATVTMIRITQTMTHHGKRSRSSAFSFCLGGVMLEGDSMRTLAACQVAPCVLMAAPATAVEGGEGDVATYFAASSSCSPATRLYSRTLSASCCSHMALLLPSTTIVFNSRTMRVTLPMMCLSVF